MKTLVIAEKPSVARDIVGALPGSFDEHKNFYESDDYVVTFAVGHLLELSDPEDYDPAWKSWKLENLPIIPTDHAGVAFAHGSRVQGFENDTNLGMPTFKDIWLSSE